MKTTEKKAWRIELREICKILIANGVNIEKIVTSKYSPNKKRIHTTLKDIDIEGINIDKIIKDNGLDENFPIGYYINKYRNAYNGTQGNLTTEEREEGEKLGIVIKHKEYSSKPIFKGRKLSQFHLDFINELIDKILNGELNTLEVLQLLEQASIEHNEAVIKDIGTIKRCVEILLKDKPEKLNKYYETLKKNMNSHTRKGNIGNPGIGLYQKKELEFKQKIIEYYLPLILKGKTTFSIISQELSTSYHTVDAIIKEFYIKHNDMKGLEDYEAAKKENIGIQRREEADRKRDEVSNDRIATKEEFIFLTPKRQEEELIKKIRVEQLKEELSETSKSQSALTGEEFVKEKINNIMNYFRRKNSSDSSEIYFSDADIRLMIFRYPTLIRRTANTLDKKLNVLTSYEEINERTAYGMIKEFPAIIGYGASRTKKQLDLLKQENLIDAAISTPTLLYNPVELLYAQIQYAKARHKTSDLSNISRSNIFMSNGTLKRLYKTTTNAIKEQYKYPGGETQNFAVTPNEIAKATYHSSEKSADAEKVLQTALQTIKKGKQK